MFADGNQVGAWHVILGVEVWGPGMGMLMKAGVLLTALGFTLLSACADKVVSAGEGVSARDVSVLVSERADAGMDALGGGRLEVVGGCLGASGSVIVWPHGTEVVNDEPLTIDIPNYGTCAVGDEVRVGGGFVLEHPSDDIEPGPYEAGGVTVPDECAKYDIFLAH